MSFTGDVEIDILDGGGSVVVPGRTVQLVIGTAQSGTAAQLVATRNPNTLASVFTAGPLVQAAGLTCQKGGTVLALRAATVTAGYVVGTERTAKTITGATNATPIVVTATGHGYETGYVATISGVGGNTAANGTFVITKVDADTFSLNGVAGAGAYTSGGSALFTGVVQSGTGANVTTLTGTPYDDTNTKIKFVKGGTTGTTGITFQVSFDAGRHFGPTLSLGTSTTFALTDIGITLTFGSSKTVVAGDTIQFSTVAPLWDTNAVADCIDAFNASQYAVAGVGSSHLVGTINGSDANTINTDLEDIATNFDVFTRMIMSIRDAKLPTSWGGLGETESTWMNALALDVSALSARRVLLGAGHYNMASALRTKHGGSPTYRRPLTWAVAARRVTIPPQRHDGRVRDGALSNISIDPTNDPQDGFLYHDEFFSPGLDDARLCSARTRRGRPGFFVKEPNLMSPAGSVFTLLPLGNVMDIACGIVHQVGEDEINDDLQLNDNGTLPDDVARSLGSSFFNAIKTNMIDKKQISNATVVVDTSNNVRTTKNVNVAVTIFSRGYVLEETITIGFSESSPE